MGRAGRATAETEKIGAGAALCAERLTAAQERGRELEERHPPIVRFHAHRRLHIEDARHRGEALVEAHERLDLTPHPRD